MSDPSRLPAGCDISHLWDYLTGGQEGAPLPDASLEEVMEALGLNMVNLQDMLTESQKR